MKRIIMHWTGGTNTVSKINQKHYHSITDGSGLVVPGDLKPEANLSTKDGNYTAHTRALNTGSIGVAMAGMYGARHTPFDAGTYPIRQKQLNAFIEDVAEYADTYNIPVTDRTILTHAEVQPTLGVAQRGKWDITWLPGWRFPRDPVIAGDALRQLVRVELEKSPVVRYPVKPSLWARIFRW